MPDRMTIGVVCTRGIGPARGGRERNEDNYLVCHGTEARFRDGAREGVLPVRALGTLVAVADGMGGHEDGDLAATAAVQAMTRIFKRGYPADPEQDLRHFVLDAHRRLRRKAAERGPVKMGTTLTIAWIIEGQAHWCQVGDSRLYLWRRGRMTQITRDQTWEEFAERDGRRVAINNGFLAQNFVYGSRGLGDDDGIRIDLGVDTGSLALEVGDRLLFCSDGLSQFVQEHRIADVILDAPHPQAAATAMVERALAAGSNDNVTAMVARVDEVSLRVDEGDEDNEWYYRDNTLVPLE